jgi:hypothetical protein
MVVVSGEEQAAAQSGAVIARVRSGAHVDALNEDVAEEEGKEPPIEDSPPAKTLCACCCRSCRCRTVCRTCMPTANLIVYTLIGVAGIVSMSMLLAMEWSNDGCLLFYDTEVDDTACPDGLAWLVLVLLSSVNASRSVMNAISSITDVIFKSKDVQEQIRSLQQKKKTDVDEGYVNLK